MFQINFSWVKSNCTLSQTCCCCWRGWPRGSSCWGDWGCCWRGWPRGSSCRGDWGCCCRGWPRGSSCRGDWGSSWRGWPRGRGLYFPAKLQNHWSALVILANCLVHRWHQTAYVETKITIFSTISLINLISAEFWLDLAKKCWRFVKFQPFCRIELFKNPAGGGSAGGNHTLLGFF